MAQSAPLLRNRALPGHSRPRGRWNADNAVALPHFGGPLCCTFLVSCISSDAAPFLRELFGVVFRPVFHVAGTSPGAGCGLSCGE